MQPVSAEFVTAIHSPGRECKSQVIISRTGYADLTYDDTTVLSFKRTSATVSGENFEIGSVVSTEFDVELNNLDGSLSGITYQNAIVKPSIGVQLANGSYEYCPLGVFFVDTVDKQDASITLTCFDGMIELEVLHVSDLTYPATLLQIAGEIAAKGGLTLATTNFPNASLSVPTAPDLSGVTLRQALGWVAEAAGCFARINRTDQIEIAWYDDTSEAITTANYYTLTTADVATTPYDDVISSTNTTSAISHVYQISNNPLLSGNFTDAYPVLYSQLKGFSYMPYEASWQGNPALDAGDRISVTNKDGTTYRTIVLGDELDYDGGIKADTKAVSQTDTQQSFSQSGSLTQQVAQTAQQQGDFINLTTQNLQAVNATIENLNATTAKITDLQAVSAQITNLQVDTAMITNLAVTTAKIDDAAITTAKIEDAAITTAQIANATIGTAQIQIGAITTALIDTGAVNTAQIADGSITDAKIVDLTANKITAGTIDASKITVTNLDCANLTVGTINGEQIANGAIDVPQLSAGLNENISNAISSALAAQTTANGKSTAYYGYDQPTNPATADIWFEPATGGGINPLQWNGITWISVTDAAVSNKISKPITLVNSSAIFTTGASDSMNDDPPYAIDCGGASGSGTFIISCGAAPIFTITRIFNGGDAYGNRI